MHCLLLLLSIQSADVVMEPPAETRPVPVPAGSLVVLPEPGYFVDSDTVVVASRFIADAYAEVCELPPPDTVEGAKWRAAAGSQGAALAALAGRTVLSVELVALEEKLLVLAARYDPGSNTVPAQRITVHAAGRDELLVVGRRIGEALCSQVPLEHTRGYHTIMAEEATEAKRVSVELDVGARLNLVMPFSQVALQPLMAGGLSLRWGAESYFLELGVGAMIPAAGAIEGAHAYGGVYVDAGAGYFLYADSVGVYVGGGLMPSLLWPSNGDIGVHLAPYATLGVELLRYSRGHLIIDFRVAQHVLPFTSRSDWGEASATHFPTEMQLGFAMVF